MTGVAVMVCLSAPGGLVEAYAVVFDCYQPAFVQVAYGLLVAFLADLELLVDVFGRALVGQRARAAVLSM